MPLDTCALACVPVPSSPPIAASPLSHRPPHPQHSPHACRAGLKACVDVGRLRDAERLLARMAEGGVEPDVRAYNILLSGHSRAANTRAMSRLLSRMAAAGVTPSAVTYNTLVDGYVRARDLGAAKRVAAQAAGAGVPLDVWTYSTLVKGHVQVRALGDDSDGCAIWGGGGRGGGAHATQGASCALTRVALWGRQFKRCAPSTPPPKKPPSPRPTPTSNTHPGR
jgi:pentatricopeptide repeat protein